LRKLYSAFPHGWPGIGLLLLRAAIGLTMIIQGSAWFSDLQALSAGGWAICLLACGTGSLLVVGFLTPIVGTLAALGGLGIMLLSPSPASWNLFSGNPLSLDVLVMGIASSLLGPGAFSLDARLFGRRKIIIPRSSRSLSPKL